MPNIQTIASWSLGMELKQCRAKPLCLGSGGVDAVLLAYSSSINTNPWHEMFMFPTDTLKLAVFDLAGKQLWERDLGPGVLPDHNFCPIYTFDLDNDGVDEVYFVNNIDEVHPFAISKYRLERVNAKTGETEAQESWPDYNAYADMCDAYRNAIVGGYVHGEPVLITAQGTYGAMYLQAWDADLSKRWELEIPADSPGARGSHMYPVLDINNDGVDELMWGERCIELDTGKELFCCDRDSYCGHSDIIQPFIDPKTGDWLIFTAREKQNFVAPRVGTSNAKGARVWGDLDHGHIHTGWVAHLSEGVRTAVGVRIGQQIWDKKGRRVSGHESFVYNASTGESLELPFDPYRTYPVDINGDGLHEIAGAGRIIDAGGHTLGTYEGQIIQASKLLDQPGEQLLVYSGDGTIQILADLDACDSDAAVERYAHPFYKLSQRFGGSILGGI